MNVYYDRNDFERRRIKTYAVFTLFWTCSASFTLCLFLYGFFPTKVVSNNFAGKDDIPANVLHTSLEKHAMFYKQVSRLVFVLVDAFRWDFLNVPSNMPYVHSLRTLRKATFLTARCHPPTATMPRVKALMTGSVPNYVDVILNLGSHQVLEDNLIHQAVTNGLKVVFYGDEVWLNLFPDKFVRKEGTTSFFVSDYTEVDLNVTRHIGPEMEKSDWDILILHYLGLDHIGHIAGPSSSMVPDKLREMDTVIKKLHENLLQWDLQHPQNPSLMVIIGDHGMHDLGGHGGASLGETLVSLILVESAPYNTSIMSPEIFQIDMAATLSVLMGLPIPKSSLGALVPHALRRLSNEQYLFALLYNAQQVASWYLQTHKNPHSQDCFRMFLEAQTAHQSWLRNQSENVKNYAESLYINSTRMMSSDVVKTLVKFDLTLLVISCLILFQILLCLFFQGLSLLRRNNFLDKMSERVTSLFVVEFLLLVCSILISQICDTSFFGLSMTHLCIMIYALIILGMNFWILSFFFVYYVHFQLKSVLKTSALLRLGSVLHTISLSTSSLIEEEHQTWYFLWTTLLVLVFVSVRCDGGRFTSVQFQVLCLLMSHRVLRKLNQTGDKWASLSDIADWLEMPEQKLILTFSFFVGILGIWLSLCNLKCAPKTSDKILYCLTLICVFLYRSSTDDIHFPIFHGFSRGLYEVKVFWFLCGLIFIKALPRIAALNYLLLLEVIKLCTSIWVLICTLLLKPSNVILIPYMVVSSFILKKVFKHASDCCWAHVWLGTVVFFYQGNSNSLSTVNVAVGYIGAEHENILTAGLLVFIHTFSFPIMATLLMWLQTMADISSTAWRQEMITNLTISFFLRVLPLSVYCILIIFQRTHLFIWSVFAPKLLYEAVHSIVCFLLVAIGCVLLLSSRISEHQLLRRHNSITSRC